MLQRINVDSSKITPRQKQPSERSHIESIGHGDLEMVQEEREREDSSEHQSEDADDEQELSKAASVIQMKYRQRLERRSRGDITLDNGNLSGKCMNLS